MMHKNGSIVLYVLMMLSVVVILTQQLVRSIFVGSQFTKTMVSREHAEVLALSGVNVAIAMLTYDEKDDKEGAVHEGQSEAQIKPDKKEMAAGEGKLTGVKKFLSRTIPYVNRWKNFELKEKIDGIDAVLRICLTCERGKININEAFDFQKMEFKKSYEGWLKMMEIPGRVAQGEMVSKLTEFFKKRKKKLDDISQLQEIPALSGLDIFYQPPQMPIKGKKSQPNSSIALQDIFTTWTEDEKIDPLWLSDALCALIGLRRPHADDATVRKERYSQFIQSFEKNMAGDWDTNWKVLENLYDQKPKILAEIKNNFTKVFGPKTFSVLSCGKVGLVEQKVLAVIREETVEEQATDKQKGEAGEEKSKESPSQPKKQFRILRVYWL